MPGIVPLSLYTVRDPAQAAGLLAHVQDYAPGNVGADPVAPVSGDAGSGDGVFTMFPVARAGEWIGSFFTDWYFRVHLIPAVFDLGNLVSDQLRSLIVWSAFPGRSQTLLSATLDNGDGIEVTAPGAMPLTFAPLQLHTWQMGISLDGPPTIAATWTFQFADSEIQLGNRIVPITGARVVPWTFTPDWSEGVTERLGWLTDVMGSPTRDEQRRELRESPTRQFEARSLLTGAERTHFDVAMYAWGGRTWALPVWPDIGWLGARLDAGATFVPASTAGRDFVDGGLALLRAGDMEASRRYEVVEIQTVGVSGLTLERPTLQSWPRGSRLYPVRLAQLPQQPQVRRLNEASVEVRYQFEVVEPCDWPAVAPVTLYRGLPVLEQTPEESEPLPGDWERVLSARPNPLGYGRRTETADTPAVLAQHRQLLSGRTEQAQYRSLLYYLRGRFARLWVPTFAADLTLAAPVLGTAAAIDVVAVDYPRYAAGKTGRRDIRVELFDGRVFHRRIDSASSVDFDTERLVLDAPLGVDVAPGQVRRISFMAVSRSNTDSVEIAHLTDSDGTARSSLIFRSLRDDL